MCFDGLVLAASWLLRFFIDSIIAATATITSTAITARIHPEEPGADTPIEEEPVDVGEVVALVVGSTVPPVG